MRCLLKAAALLLSHCVASLVIPEHDHASLGRPISDEKVDYHFGRAKHTILNFPLHVDSVEPSETSTVLTFQVEGTNKACGESNVLLGGQKLESQWDGITAHGRDYLDTLEGQEAEWHISCLFNVVPEDGSNSKGDDVVHVLSLRVLDGTSRPGFTVSYKQLGPPAILRFKPVYYPTDMATVPALASLWRIPSVDFDPDVLENEEESASTALVESLHRGQKNFQTKLAAIKSTLKAGAKKFGKILCHKTKEGFHEVETSLAGELDKISSDKLLEPPPYHNDELADEPTSATETSIPTSTFPAHSAATTRSLSHVEALDPTPSSTSAHLLPSQSEHNLHFIKIFGLGLILASCLVWMFLRCRDPRRRAERLARMEERRNQNLYRRAARQHRRKMWLWNRQQEIRTWVWKFRVRYNLAPKKAIALDEKRARAMEQEGILEDVMKNDIRALRNAYRVVSDITIAEEGRSGLAYESEGSERRRSVSTLPGYESEGSQPPSYDDAGDIMGEAAVVNGFRYTAAETEFRSDSSVISTSPRISRDGTNSEFEEKIEPISLETSGPAGLGL